MGTDNASARLAMRSTDRRALGALVLMLGACASHRENMIPSSGPTMLQVYRAHRAGQGPGRDGLRERLPLREPEDMSPAAATRTARHETEALFPRLPNPDLTMFRFPHLTAHGVPVPGYTTVFPMYDHVQYAMPGEGAVLSRALVDEDATAIPSADGRATAPEPQLAPVGAARMGGRMTGTSPAWR